MRTLQSSMYAEPTTCRYTVDKKWFFNRYVPAVLPHVNYYLSDIFKHDKDYFLTLNTDQDIVVLADSCGTHAHTVNALREKPGYFNSLKFNHHADSHWFLLRRRGPVTETTPDEIWRLINKRP